ncbi:hypothetical protein EDB86DRAFT_2836713 [Lactarius hatsudake]|nr:hypothetical protein EDB86DRAFT_2836713 [Lactarius hatsudake]
MMVALVAGQQEWAVKVHGTVGFIKLDCLRTFTLPQLPWSVCFEDTLRHTTYQEKLVERASHPTRDEAKLEPMDFMLYVNMMMERCPPTPRDASAGRLRCNAKLEIQANANLTTGSWKTPEAKSSPAQPGRFCARLRDCAGPTSAPCSISVLSARPSSNTQNRSPGSRTSVAIAHHVAQIGPKILYDAKHPLPGLTGVPRYIPRSPTEEALRGLGHSGSNAQEPIPSDRGLRCAAGWRGSGALRGPDSEASLKWRRPWQPLPGTIHPRAFRGREGGGEGPSSCLPPRFSLSLSRYSDPRAQQTTRVFPPLAQVPSGANHNPTFHASSIRLLAIRRREPLSELLSPGQVTGYYSLDYSGLTYCVQAFAIPNSSTLLVGATGWLLSLDRQNECGDVRFSLLWVIVGVWAVH